MVTTRSGTKRKAMDKADLAEPAANPPSSTPKRQRLPLRKKNAEGATESPAPKKGSAKKTPSKKKQAEDAPAEKEGDDVENAAVEDEDAGDIMAALQRQLAAAHPSPAVLKKAETPATAPTDPQESEEDSDDEAPEAISNVQAAEAVKQAAQASQKAAQQQAAQAKKKRQERDALFKAQAKTRRQTKPGEEEEPATAEIAAPTEGPADDVTEAKEEAEQEQQVARSGKVKLPEFLPQEFLDSDDDEDAYQGDLSSIGEPNPKRRKSEQKKAPKDKRVGSTVYRVMSEVDQRLAPRKEKRSKDVRARLLKRNRSAATQQKGFIVGRPMPKPDWGSSRR